MDEETQEPENDATVVVAVQNETPDNGETTAAIVASEIAAETAVTAVEASTVAVEASNQANEQAAAASDVAAQAVETANATRDHIASLKEELDARDSRLLAALEERFGPRQQSDQPKEVVVTNASTTTQHADSGQGDNSGSGGGAGNGTDRPAYRHRFGRGRS